VVRNEYKPDFVSEAGVAIRAGNKLCKISPLPQEQEMKSQGQQRLKQRHSQIPWHREQAEKCGEEFWRKLYDSCILS